jgi:hypothetical protein
MKTDRVNVAHEIAVWGREWQIGTICGHLRDLEEHDSRHEDP